MNDLDLLLDLAQKHTQLKQVGSGRYLGLCPIHNEKTASFWIYPNGKYRCFGCGSSGDAIDLYRALNDCDYITAKKALGLWDNARPAPRPKPKPWPKQYATDDKRKAYKAARASVIAAKDMDIIYKGHTYLNHEFIGRCLAPLPDYYDHVMKICVQISANAKTDMDRYVLPDLFFENVIDVIEQYRETET